MAKAKFRITTIEEVEADIGDLRPEMIRDLFIESKDGFLTTHNWYWGDFAEPKIVSYVVEIV